MKKEKIGLKLLELLNLHQNMISNRLNIQNGNEECALKIASKKGLIQIVHKLLQFGAIVNIQDNEVRNILIFFVCDNLSITMKNITKLSCLRLISTPFL